MDYLRATIEDAASLLTLQRLAYQSEATLYNNFNIPPLRQTLEQLQAEFATNIFLKAVDQGQIVGSVRAYLNDGVCNIGRLIVHPSHQQRGIGTTLMRQIEACYPTATAYRLFTGNRSEGNIRLYQRLGYSITHSEMIEPQLALIHMEKAGSVPASS